MKIIKPIPTTVVTGFLGSGKTSLITQWIKQKPSHEVWAVLVNEYGEMGIDGTWLAGIKQAADSVYIKEVPGGCMCCSANLMAQVALNQLIQQTRPDRLIVEPSGLGHPASLLAQLTSPHYRDYLRINAVLTLVDARRLADPRVLAHPLFQQQISMADTVIASKSDLYEDSHQALLSHYLQHQQASPDVIFSHQEGLPLSLLQQSGYSRHYQHVEASPAILKPVPVETEQASTPSCHFTFDAAQVFSLRALIHWLDQANYLRLKAVVITDEGVVGINHVSGETSYAWLDDASHSRFEAIDVDEAALADAISACCLVMSQAATGYGQ